MIINTFNINTNILPSTEVSRSFNVVGEIGAQFMIVAIQNPSSSGTHTLYYDFFDKSFESGHNDLNNNLIVTMKSNTYNDTIKFPSGGGEFVIKLIPVGNTTLQNSRHAAFTRAITKSAADPVVTFQIDTASTSNYTTLPTATSTIPAGSSGSVKFNWDITNVSNDSNGFGLRLIDTIYNITTNNFYFKTTETVDATQGGHLELYENTVDGAISSATEVTLDHNVEVIALTGIVAGMYVYGTGVTAGTTVSGTGGAGTKTITLSAAMTISDGVTLTFVHPRNYFVVDDLTDIAVGMEISSVSGTNSYLIGTPVITDIKEDENMIFINTEQAFADGITLTFKAVGQQAISAAIGLDFDIPHAPEVTPTTLTKTIASGSSGTTINLNGTYGIAGGNNVTISGLNIDNSSANAITSVSASSSAGSITVQNSQSGLITASTLTFTGCHQTVNITGDIIIDKQPVADRTIHLNLDELITVGAAS